MKQENNGTKSNRNRTVKADFLNADVIVLEIAQRIDISRTKLRVK
jgi:hypothetical protein